MNQSKRLTFTLVSTLILGWLLTIPSVATGQPASDKCHPVDLVILLDQSGSMYGDPRPPANDLEGRRFDAAVTIADSLANHSIWLCYENGIQHRIAVVGFGDRANESADGPDNPYLEDVEIYLPSITIPADALGGRSQDDLIELWEGELRNEIEAQINQGTNDNLGATDHRSAFLVANDILTDWRNTPLGDLPRRQGTILLTDGEPCILNRDCPPQTYSLTVDLMEELEDLTNPTTGEFKFYGEGNPESTYISMLLLSRSQGFETSQDYWERIARSHGGDVFPVTSNEELAAIINDALDPITGSGREPLQCGEPTWILPYLDNVIILYSFPLRENPQGQPVLNIESDGDQYALRGGVAITGDIEPSNYRTFRGNESYVLNSPPPGRYEVIIPGLEDCTDELSLKVERGSVTAELLTPENNIKLPTVAEAPFYSDALTRTFAVRVNDRNGNPLEEIDNYPLLITATVQNGSEIKSYPLDPVGGGLYESAPIETPNPSEYTWEIVANVRHPNPDEGMLEIQLPADKRRFTGRFEATPIDLLLFDIIEPIDGDRLALNQVNGVAQIPNQLPVTIAVTDANGEPVDVVNTLENDGVGVFTAFLIQDSGRIVTTTLTLDMGTLNQFRGAFSNGNVDNVYESGDFTIQVQADWGGAENYNELEVAPALDRASVVVEQYQIEPLQVELIPPQGITLRQASSNRLDMFLHRNGLQPFEIGLRVIDPLASEDETIFLEQVLTGMDNFEVVVQTPNGMTETIALVPNPDPAVQTLVGTGGEVLNEAGEYRVSMRVRPEQLQEEYAWATMTYETSFMRVDTFYTQPATWYGANAIAIIIALMVIGAIVYAKTGGPSGYLIISDGDGDLLELKLRKSNRTNKFKKPTLKNAGIGKITVRKGYENMISVSVETNEGYPVPLEMEPGQSDFATDRIQIRYRNDSAPTASYDDDTFDDDIEI